MSEVLASVLWGNSQVALVIELATVVGAGGVEAGIDCNDGVYTAERR